MIIQVSNLTKKYKNITAVNDLSLRINEGEIFGLLGPNGAGKSTTINTILGLLTQDSGKIEIMGHDMSRPSKEVKSNIGYVPQDLAFYEEMSAYTNVKYWAKLYGLKGREVEKATKEALEFTGLWERRKDKAKGYSGGMKRRLNIACGIVHKPKILFMDEPTVGVDPQSRNNIRESIRKLNQSGTTVIYTSHYMEEVEELCNRIVIIDNGKVLAQGTIDELIESVPSEKNVVIECKNITDDIETVVKSAKGVQLYRKENTTIHIVMDKDEEYFSNLVERLVEAKAEILSMNVEKMNLEAVFLKLTGKTLRD